MEISTDQNRAPDHVVQFFDTAGSLAAGAAGFLASGLDQDAATLIVAADDHWHRIAASLRSRHDPDREIADGRLLLHQPAALLKRISKAGRPNQALFDDVVGRMVRRLGARGRGVYVYGEIVNVLAGEGDYAAACVLEEFWTALGRQVPFKLYCGYSSSHFGDRRHLAALRRICALHSHVHAEPADELGAWLVNDALATHTNPGPVTH